MGYDIKYKIQYECFQMCVHIVLIEFNPQQFYYTKNTIIQMLQ